MRLSIPLLLAILLLSSCAAPRVQQVQPHDALALMGRGDVIVLDVRTPEEFSLGHLQGARNIDYFSPSFGTDLDALDKERAYLVYCGSGKRSENATLAMFERGFEQVYELQGGTAAWEEAGLSLSR